MYRSDPELREKVREAYHDLVREDPDAPSERRHPPAPPLPTPRSPVRRVLAVLLVAALLLAVTWRVVHRRDPVSREPSGEIPAHDPPADTPPLDQALQRMRAGAYDEACGWFHAGWQALPTAERARVDTVAIANAERTCGHDFESGAAMYEHALQPVTRSP